jgi:ATP-dependent RNA helicase DDX54/DBP10
LTLLCRYSLNDGASSFAKQANTVAFDLEGDEGDGKRKRQNSMTWDKKKKRFIKGDGVGADNVKMIRTESGTKLPATYRSGRFDEWKKQHHVSLPRVGEAESTNSRGFAGKKFKHNQVTAPKPLDKLDKNYDRKFKRRKEKEAAVGGDDSPVGPPGRKPLKGKPQSKRHGGKSYGKVKSELKTVDQIRKDRKVTEQRKLKNARPSKKGRR